MEQGREKSAGVLVQVSALLGDDTWAVEESFAAVFSASQDTGYGGPELPMEPPDLDVLPIHSLRLTDVTMGLSVSPRSQGVDLEHAQGLAESGTKAPPILVHRPTMQVIDGRHRLRAAELRGDEYVEARFFEGSEADAFVLAVRLNAEHGLPLQRSDRMAAAQRIMCSHPQWSDRRIAHASALSARTIAALRRSMDNVPILPVRVGSDGRVRPMSAAEGRSKASELIRSGRQLSLRQIAREAGISLGTARDVKQRVLSGRDVIPQGQRERRRGLSVPNGSAQTETRRIVPGERKQILAQLTRDPSLRLTEKGRTLLRMLAAHPSRPEEWQQIVDNIPRHSVDALLSLAQSYAEDWQIFARQLEECSRQPADTQRVPADDH
ncbi:ParB/RepB/Spo0J family partition protein [Streptomyces sp. MB09-02B]|uniref:ParB/RepB/Spo0J family partition protein n=1 Tax=Streptomyces sp. MB09-02B TaxID=3028667 RepID=UPI0029B9A0A3|nr:ParB N-terminal domain-containing protein [Streptomyces sp. MB09-02B]MDX3638418.1 ParB N-terminal domain-containing protein [Streptomyces sp. MB09-02B]